MSRNRPEDGTRLLLPGIPAEILLEEGGERVLELAPRSWMCRVATGPVRHPQAVYRLWLRPGIGRDVVQGSVRPVLRVDPEGSGERLVCGASGVELAPGRGAAVLVSPPGHGQELLILLETVLAHMMALNGASYHHALGMELAGRSILAFGDSGAGKSTLAAAGLARGARLLSDDSLYLTWTRDEFEARPLRRDAVFRRAARDLLPSSLGGRLESFEGSEEPRWRLRRDRAAERFLTMTRPELLLFLRRDGSLEGSASGFALRELDQATALACLAMAGFPLVVSRARYAAERRTLLEGLTALASSVRAWEVSLAPDGVTRPGGADHLLSELARL